MFVDTTSIQYRYIAETNTADVDSDFKYMASAPPPGVERTLGEKGGAETDF